MVHAHYVCGGLVASALHTIRCSYCCGGFAGCCWRSGLPVVLSGSLVGTLRDSVLVRLKRMRVSDLIWPCCPRATVLAPAPPPPPAAAPMAAPLPPPRIPPRIAPTAA